MARRRLRPYTSKRIASIAARAHIVGAAEPRDDVDLGYRTAEGHVKLQPRQIRVPIAVDFVLDRLITRAALAAENDPARGLGGLSILHWARQLTTYPVFPDELPLLERLVESRRARSN